MNERNLSFNQRLRAMRNITLREEEPRGEPRDLVFMQQSHASNHWNCTTGNTPSEEYNKAPYVIGPWTDAHPGVLDSSSAR